jgi:phosphorylcholine metabolism protein LicD
MGSLLGAVREHDMPYQAIPWEHDVDVCVYQKDYDRVISLMQEDPNLEVFVERRCARYSDSYHGFDLRARITRSYVDFYFVEDDEAVRSHAVAVMIVINNRTPSTTG